jgi:hypothetical protein
MLKPAQLSLAVQRRETTAPNKRFILVDTLGLVLTAIVTEANFPERLGVQPCVLSEQRLPII